MPGAYPNAQDPVESKTIQALRNTFQTYANGQLDVEMPLCKEDKQAVKNNVRKLNLYDNAFRFCDETFDFTIPSDEMEEGWLDTPLS